MTPHRPAARKGVSPELSLALADEVRFLASPSRRWFLGSAARRIVQGGLTVGGLSLLSGCVIDSGDQVEAALQRISALKDKAQAWLFDPQRLAPTDTEAEVVRHFPFNAYYSENESAKWTGTPFAWRSPGWWPTADAGR